LCTLRIAFIPHKYFLTKRDEEVFDDYDLNCRTIILSAQIEMFAPYGFNDSWDENYATL
jgi:hypothetical protein